MTKVINKTMSYYNMTSLIDDNIKKTIADSQILINENNFYEDKIFLERSKTYTKFLNNFNKLYCNIWNTLYSEKQ